MVNVLLAAEEEHGELFSPVVPVLSELIWAAVFFTILFLIVSRVALPKLNKVLAEREAAVTGQITAADQVRADADVLLADYRAKLADAQSEANRIIDEGRRTAEGIVTEARSRAEAEAQTIVTRAQSDIRAESNRAQVELRSTLAELSIQVAGRVVGQSLDSDAQRQLVERYIDELSTTASQN
ncbi:MAG TPA: F0F1 ATP synthase subunit B [Mycobacteriales bacterium]|nr:F0F1 ATP synthase subunit B [Mycobacteriales bacterium]